MYLKMYSIALGAYPASFRSEFAPEMLDVFEQRAIHLRGRGRLMFVNFLMKEICGVVSGAVMARVGQRFHSAHCELAFPSDINGAERYIEAVLSKLIRAIANHDFVNTRYFDEQDRKARALLAEMRSASHSG